MVGVSDLHDISEIVIATQRENYKRINNQNSRLNFSWLHISCPA
jgi:hypothetical protein